MGTNVYGTGSAYSVSLDTDQTIKGKKTFVGGINTSNNSEFKAAGGARMWTGNAGGTWNFSPGAATSPSVKVYGEVNQTANIVEFLDSSGVLKSGVTSLGYGFFGGGHVGGHLSATSPLPDQRPFVVRGAASQGANLTEWHDSAGSLLTSIAPNGNIRRIGTNPAYEFSDGVRTARIGHAAGPGHFGLPAIQGSIVIRSDEVNYGVVLSDGPNGASLSVRSNTGTVVSGTNAGVPTLRVEAAASQTAPLLSLRNSAGTELAYFEGSIGALRIKHVDVNSNVWVGMGGTGTNDNLVKFRGRGMPSQTENLLQLENSTAAVVMSVSPSGWTRISPANNQNLTIGSNGGNNGGSNSIIISNATAPTTNISGGGSIYVSSGRLMYRGELGTVTQLAAA